MVEDYYGITADVRVVDTLLEDFVDEEPSSTLSAALEDLDVSHKRVTDFTEITISSRKIDVSSSPSFTATVHTASSNFDQEMIIDSGCTGEAVVSEDWATRHNIAINPSSIRAARMADQSSSLVIVGEVLLHFTAHGNQLKINALVARGADDFPC